MQITILKIKHIWRRVDPAKRPVNIKWIRRCIKAEPLGYLNLENIPCRYIFLCLLHLPDEFLFGYIRRPVNNCLVITPFIVTMLQRPPKVFDYSVYLLYRLFISTLQIIIC